MKKEKIDINEFFGDNYDTMSIGEPKKSHAIRNTVIIILSILLLLAVTVATLIVLAFQKPNSDKFGAKPSSDLIETVVMSALYDEDADISNSEINSFIAFSLDEYEKNSEESGGDPLPIKGLALFVHKDAPCEVFAQVEIGGNIFEVSGEFTLEQKIDDKQIEMNVTSIKIGNLPLPPSLVLDYIFNNTELTKSLDFINREGTDIFIDSEYGFDVFGQNINLEIIKIQSEDDGLTLKTTSAASIIQDTLDSWLESWL